MIIHCNKLKVITYDPANFKKNDFAITKCNNVISLSLSYARYNSCELYLALRSLYLAFILQALTATIAVFIRKVYRLS